MQITSGENAYHIQLWTTALPGIVWYKENLQNIGINILTGRHPEWRYLALVDGDFLFERDAFAKTIDALQHYDVVQMWSHVINLAPSGGVLSGVSNSFMYCYANGIQRRNASAYEQGAGGPGGAWAYRRDAINKIGGALGSPLIDWNIVGGGDRAMARALTGQLRYAMNPKYTASYRDSMYAWEDVAVRNLKKNIGYVDNTLRHMWHGRPVDRGYDTRWKILVDYRFDPVTDLKRDVSGIWQLNVHDERTIRMRDELRKYFFTRMEDATTVI